MIESTEKSIAEINTKKKKKEKNGTSYANLHT